MAAIPNPIRRSESVAGDAEYSDSRRLRGFSSVLEHPQASDQAVSDGEHEYGEYG
jgi:hypothetical protein